jgi:hypothetical protein
MQRDSVDGVDFAGRAEMTALFIFSRLREKMKRWLEKCT